MVISTSAAMGRGKTDRMNQDTRLRDGHGLREGDAQMPCSGDGQATPLGDGQEPRLGEGQAPPLGDGQGPRLSDDEGRRVSPQGPAVMGDSMPAASSSPGASSGVYAALDLGTNNCRLLIACP